jgi:SET domain-containing protein
MLLVPARVGPSVIHGLGLFALERIPRGTRVWIFSAGFDLDLDSALVDAQPANFRTRLLHYGYVDARLKRYILCCDDARFINHSDAPNLCSEFEEDSHGIDVAVRDIEEGEEITLDYRFVEGGKP